MTDLTINSFVNQANSSKVLFTPGPVSLTPENILGINPYFGRCDPHYDNVESEVLSSILNLTNHKHIARMQGSATFAIEVAVSNFVFGRVLVVGTGYYSERLYNLANAARISFGYIESVQYINYSDISCIDGNFDWILCCHVETSIAFKADLKYINELASSLSSRLLVDSTASIGLEDNDDLADVICFSSCKGLFGLTGASFISYNELSINAIHSFSLDINTYLLKKTTGPYHAIGSLYHVLKNYNFFRDSVKINKAAFMAKFSAHTLYKDINQPLLCTYTDSVIHTNDQRVILYTPRQLSSGSVVCHLGEVHLGSNAKAEILNLLYCS